MVQACAESDADANKIALVVGVARSFSLAPSCKSQGSYEDDIECVCV